MRACENCKKEYYDFEDIETCGDCGGIIVPAQYQNHKINIREEVESIINETKKMIPDALAEAKKKLVDSLNEDDDEINHPKHYKGNKFESIEVIEDFELNYCLGNAVKYILRAGKKGTKEDEIKDLKKCIWYINREIEKKENEVK